MRFLMICCMKLKNKLIIDNKVMITLKLPYYRRKTKNTPAFLLNMVIGCRPYTNTRTRCHFTAKCL